MVTIRTSDSQSIYDLKYPGAAIDAILDTAYDLQNAGYIFRGLASEYSNTPTERSWVLAGEGETGHGFTSPVPKGYIGVCVFNGTSWTGKLLKCVSIDSTPTNGSTNAVSSGGAYASISQLADTVAEALDNLTFTDATPSSFLGDYINMKVSTTDNGVERILTFFTILAATTSKAGLLSAADKAKLDAILGNLRSLEIDDTTAYADLGDKIVESIKATIGGTEETISTFQLLAATASKAGLLSAADKAKLDAMWSSGYQFAGIATPSTTPISTTSKIFYIATEAGTYFNAVTVTKGINILSWNGTAWSAVQVVGIDDEPTVGSDNLVKSGGVSLIANDLEHRASGTLMLMSGNLVVARQVDVLSNATSDTCIKLDGTTASEEGYFVSAPFNVSKGEVVCVYGRCNRDKTIIAKHDNGAYTKLVGTVQSLPIDRYCYVAEDDMEIAICCALSDFRYCRILKEDSEKALSSATKGETVFINNFDDLTHAYINFDGTTTEYSTYYITDTISIPAGSILQAKLKSNGVSIAKSEGLIPLLWGHHGYEYSVNLYFEDATDIVLSGDVSQPLEYRIISSSDIDSPFSNTKGLRIKDSFDDFVEEYTFADNLYRSNGYYLDWETAKPVANLSYFISSAIPVHKGDKISINNMHESYGIAAIAYVDVVEGVTTYTPVVRSRTSSDTNLHYEYTFEKDGNCVISGHFDSLPDIEIKVYHAAYDKTAGVNYVSGYVGNILDKTVRKAINVEVEISEEYGNGAYLDKNYCEYVVYEDYYISKPINVLKGDYISITGIRSSGTTVLAYYDEVDGDPVFTNILNGVTGIRNYSYVSKKDGQVVICGGKDSLGATTFTIRRVVLEELATKAELEEVRDMIINHSSPKIINPYAGVDFDRSILSQSHEHCYDASKVANAYKRGIRVIACSHYVPAAPRYPLSSFSWEYQDYKSKEAVDNGDTETVTRTITGSIPTITVDGQTINTDTIPQIANAEHPFVKGQREHFNILGLLWAEPGHSLANGDTATATWKREHALVTPQMLNGLLEDETKWQFGSQYVFGTINHTYNVAWIKSMLNACPNIFKAMEIFNQGYSKGWNDLFKDAYDSVLRDGIRLWCTSVVDWQNDWARWDYSTQAEKDEWTEKFNALSEEEQAEYVTPENYYMETGRFKFDRGANRILLPSNYDSLSLQDKAKEVVKAYIGGRYYLVGLGNYSMQIIKDGSDITFRVSDLCPKIRVINGRTATEYTNIDSVTYNAKINDIYVRFEAEWNDGDFVYSNPIWIE